MWKFGARKMTYSGPVKANCFVFIHHVVMTVKDIEVRVKSYKIIEMIS